MYNNSRPVQSKQVDIHKNLNKTVKKHLLKPYQKPVSKRGLEIFEQIEQIRTENNYPVILDAGCGTGESTRLLAAQNPDSLVIGIDKSIHRLSRSGLRNEILYEDNLVLARMNLVHFWLLAKQHDWQCEKQWLLYPNPWPRPKHLQRRWHAHPIFPFLLSLARNLELRTNWSLYAKEFQQAVHESGAYTTTVQGLNPDTPCSPFEKKYLDSGHTVSQCLIIRDK